MKMKEENDPLISQFSRHAALLAAFTWLGLSIKLDAIATQGEGFFFLLSRFLGSFYGFSIERTLLIPFLYFFYSAFLHRNYKIDRFARLPAVLFSLFMIFGESFEKQGNWELVMAFASGQCFLAAFRCLGWYLLFVHGITALYILMDKRKTTAHFTSILKKRGVSTCISALETNPFRTAFLFLIVAYIPYFFVYYPCIFTWDSVGQIAQAFPALKNSGIGYLNQSNRLLSETVYINQHHPVAHTLLIHGFILLGDKVFNSYNIGIFLYTLFQVFFTLFVFADAVAVLVITKAITATHALLFLIYAIMHPLIPKYSFLLTKDTLYAAFMLATTVQLYRLFSKEKVNNCFPLILLSYLGVVLFRNEGRYVLLFTSILSLLLNRLFRKLILYLTIITFIFIVGIYQVLYPALSYTPGSNSEALSVPFQQTARYVHDYWNEISTDEQESIDAVLDFNSLKQVYNPMLSDPVKRTYRENVTKEQLFRYFRVWLSMFRKHPGVYLQATMNNYYQYVYPGKAYFANHDSYSWQLENLRNINRAIQPLDHTFSYATSTLWLREGIDTLSTALRHTPVFSFFMTPATYSWILFLLLFYSLRIGNLNAHTLLLIPLMTMFVCFLGPANGDYGRYQYSLILLLPLLFPMVLALSRNDSVSAGKENQ